LKDFSVAHAKTSDLKSLVEVLESTGWFDGRIDTSEQNIKIAEKTLKKLLSDPRTLFLVVRDKQEAVGFISVHFVPYLMLSGEEAFVSELFVKDTHRSKGIGSMLLTAGVQAARSRGCKRMHLINSRARDSYKRGFYAKHGWQERQYAASFILDLYDKTREPEPGK